MTGSLAVRRPVVRAPSRFDAGLAVVLAALALVDALLIEPPAEAAGLVVIGALVTTLPVAWRSVAPGSAAVVASLGLLLVASVGAADEQPTVTWFAPLIVVFALGEHGDKRTLRWAAPICVLAWTAIGIGQHDPGSMAFGLFGSVGALAVRRAVRVMGLETDVLEQRVVTLEQDPRCERPGEARVPRPHPDRRARVRAGRRAAGRVASLVAAVRVSAHHDDSRARSATAPGPAA